MVSKQKPLREPTLFILLTLTNTPKHGYAIIQEAAELSGGRVKMSNGTLYGALVRMQEERLIERLDADQVVEGRPRKLYKLTKDGKNVLDAELERLDALVKVLQHKLEQGVG